MSSSLPRYTPRIPKEYLDDIRYIAEEDRSANREIELTVKRRIAAYKKEFGEILFESGP